MLCRNAVYSGTLEGFLISKNAVCNYEQETDSFPCGILGQV